MAADRAYNSRVSDAPIYLDSNATTPLLPAVADAMREAWLGVFANPASQHGPGRAARRILEAARHEIIDLLGGDPSAADPDRLIFTSGGTEANALAVRGLLAESERRRLVVSSIEHVSVSRTAEALESAGHTVDRLPVSMHCLVEVGALEDLLSKISGDVGLVSVMSASNETGVIQPIRQIAKLCQQAGVPLHSDAVQVVGKRPGEFRCSGLSALTFAPHKFHGPLGIGGLLLSPHAKVKANLHGGFQQEGLRPGTESAALAVGAATALRIATDELGERCQRLGQLRDRFEKHVVGTWPDATVVGAGGDRLEHATCLAFPGANRQALVMAYDLAGVACSTGSACASGSSEPSPTLVAMGLPEQLVDSAVRFSLNAMTTVTEIDDAVSRIAAVHRRLLDR